MGAAVGRQAVRGGATVRWVGAGRGAATRNRAAAAGFEEFADLPSALDGTDIVLSICPPAFAEDLAADLVGFHGVFVEANAIAPARARHIASMLPSARVVDGGIIGEPPQQTGTTRLYLSGDTDGVPELFTGTDLEVVTVSGGIGQASALKMAYASYQKASRVLGALAHALARDYGVEDHLVREANLLRSLPLAEVEQYTGVAAKAWRWEPEMREVAEVMRDSGIPDGMALGAAAALSRWIDARDRDDLDLAAALRMIAARPDHLGPPEPTAQ